MIAHSAWAQVLMLASATSAAPRSSMSRTAGSSPAPPSSTTRWAG
jgi:hypothetical protein